RGILLAKGQKVFEGAAGECVDRYLADVTQNATNEVDLSDVRRGKGIDSTLKITKVRLVSDSGRPLVRCGDPLEVELIFSVAEPLEEVVLGINVSSGDNVSILECRNSHSYGAINELL